MKWSPVSFQRISRRVWLCLGVVVLLGATAALFLAVRPTGSVPRPGTNAVQVASAATVTNLATFPPPPASPDVAELLALMQRWRAEHPYFHMLVETSGPDVSSTAEVFSFVKPDGRPEARIKSQSTRPNAFTFIAEAQTNRVLAYFPKSNQVVQMMDTAAARKLLLQLGWSGKGDFDPMLVFRLAQVSFVENGDDFKALTLVFPPQAFRLPPSAGELFWTIKLDASGKVQAVEQLTLGNRVVSKLTYFDEDLVTIQKRAPEIPVTAVQTGKTFTEAVKEEVNTINSKAPVGI